MSIGKAQTVQDGKGVGKRIRFLRGSLSQEEFAAKAGISRAALANYETGRTIPNLKVIAKISQAFDVSPEFISSGEVKKVDELAVTLGLGANTPDELTGDEWAVIRVLSVCNNDTVVAVMKALVEGFSADDEAKTLADYTTIIDDLARLLMIAEGRRFYERGVRRRNLEGVIEALRRRMDQLRS